MALYRHFETQGELDAEYDVGRSVLDFKAIAMALLTAWEAGYAMPSDVIKGGCGISGLYDLAPLPYTFVQSSLQLTWDQVLRNSPILHLPSIAAPLLISYGGQEPGEFRRQSDDFLAAWSRKGLMAHFCHSPTRTTITRFTVSQMPQLHFAALCCTICG